MRVSVIVPVRNRGKYIGRCLESLLKQDIDKDSYEIIVVDNGSTDSTAQVIRSYPVKYLYLERPSISAARNLGIVNSEAEYAAFIDSDAVADKNWLKELLKGFNHPRVAACGGKILLSDKDGRQTNLVWPNNTNYIECDRYYFPIIMAGNAVFKRSLILEIGLFDDTSLLELQLEDADISLRLHFCGYTFNYVDSAVINHRSSANLKDIFKKGYRLVQGYSMLTRKYYFLRCLYGTEDSVTRCIINEFFGSLCHKNFGQNFFLKFIRAFFYNLGQLTGWIIFIIKRPYFPEANELFKQDIIAFTEKRSFGIIKYEKRCLKISKGVLCTEDPKKVVIFSIISGKQYLLNETASFIWNHILDSISKDEIISELDNNYKVGRNVLEKDFKELILDLQKKGFLDIL